MDKISHTPLIRCTTTVDQQQPLPVAATSVAPTVSQPVRDAWYREGKCVGCGTQLFEVKKKIGWRACNKNRVIRIPLTIEQQANRGQCLSCCSKQLPVVKFCVTLQQQAKTAAQCSSSVEEEGSVATPLDILDTTMSSDQPYHLLEPLGNEQLHDDNAKPSSCNKEAPLAQAASSSASTFYEGDVNSFGQPHGRGEMIFPNGDWYQGQFCNGKLHGEGMMVFANGSDYVGGWHAGFMQGMGTIRFQNGDTYCGQYAHNRRSGQGRMHFSNGDLYSGAWRDGQLHGWGKYHYWSGHKFEGHFSKGKRHGSGKYQYCDGSMITQRYENDRRVGEGVKFSVNGVRVWRVEGSQVKERITLPEAKVIMRRCEEGAILVANGVHDDDHQVKQLPS